MEWGPTSENRFGMHLERQRRRRTRIGTANARNHEAVRTPALNSNIRPCIKHGEGRCITPCQVYSAQRCTSILRKLFTEASIGWGVLGYDRNEPIGESVDRVGDRRIVIRPSSNGSRSGKRREELLEEGKGDCGDFNPGVQDVPCVNGTIELFCDSEGGKVPGVAFEIDVLEIAAKCDGLGRGDTIVDGVYTISEGVDIDLEVGERLV